MKERPLIFYVDPRWRKSPDVFHIPLLYPFWGNPYGKQAPLSFSVFEHYQFDTTCYGITDNPYNADMVLMPYPYGVALRKFPELVEECAEEAKRQNKKLLIDAASDLYYPIDIPHAIILRWGGYRFRRDPRDIHLPPYADDLLERYGGGKIQIRKKQNQKPIVGFSGWAQIPLAQEVRTTVKELPVRLRGMFDSRYRACKKGIFFRRAALKVLQSSPRIESNLLKRQSYSGHVKTAQDTPERLQKQFVDNLLSSDYGLEVRGDPNTSTRLFEICSLGRIPVILDTERIFPFSNELDYHSFSLMVDFRDLKKLPDRIADFHASLSNEQFQMMQNKARDAFRHYFRVDAVTVHLMQSLVGYIIPGWNQRR